MINLTVDSGAFTTLYTEVKNAFNDALAKDEIVDQDTPLKTIYANVDQLFDDNWATLTSVDSLYKLYEPLLPQAVTINPQFRPPDYKKQAEDFNTDVTTKIAAGLNSMEQQQLVHERKALLEQFSKYMKVDFHDVATVIAGNNKAQKNLKTLAGYQNIVNNAAAAVPGTATTAPSTPLKPPFTPTKTTPAPASQLDAYLSTTGPTLVTPDEVQKRLAADVKAGVVPEYVKDYMKTNSFAISDILAITLYNTFAAQVDASKKLVQQLAADPDTGVRQGFADFIAFLNNNKAALTTVTTRSGATKTTTSTAPAPGTAAAAAPAGFITKKTDLLMSKVDTTTVPTALQPDNSIPNIIEFSYGGDDYTVDLEEAYLCTAVPPSSILPELKRFDLLWRDLGVVEAELKKSMADVASVNGSLNRLMLIPLSKQMQDVKAMKTDLESIRAVLNAEEQVLAQGINVAVIIETNLQSIMSQIESAVQIVTELEKKLSDINLAIVDPEFDTIVTDMLAKNEEYIKLYLKPYRDKLQTLPLFLNPLRNNVTFNLVKIPKAIDLINVSTQNLDQEVVAERKRQFIAQQQAAAATAAQQQAVQKAIQQATAAAALTSATSTNLSTQAQSLSQYQPIDPINGTRLPPFNGMSGYVEPSAYYVPPMTAARVAGDLKKLPKIAGLAAEAKEVPTYLLPERFVRSRGATGFRTVPAEVYLDPSDHSKGTRIQTFDEVHKNIAQRQAMLNNSELNRQQKNYLDLARLINPQAVKSLDFKLPSYTDILQQPPSTVAYKPVSTTKQKRAATSQYLYNYKDTMNNRRNNPWNAFVRANFEMAKARVGADAMKYLRQQWKNAKNQMAA